MIRERVLAALDDSEDIWLKRVDHDVRLTWLESVWQKLFSASTQLKSNASDFEAAETLVNVNNSAFWLNARWLKLSKVLCRA